MTTTADRLLSGMTRREILAAGGVAAAVAAAPPAFGNPPGEEHFGRLFPSLPPFAAPSAKLTAAMLELGAPGGPLDAKDDLAGGAAQLILDPTLSLNNPNNPTHTAGVTFFGQFIDHDLTFDLTSRLGRRTKPRTSPNARSPAFDLDSVYGAGPEEDPEYYESAKEAEGGRPLRLKIGHGGRFEDLPRDPTTLQAIIPEPRNDENLMISGLHAAFVLFHNRLVDFLRAEGQTPPERLFHRARRLVRWHYQWLVVHEFLPLLVGQDVVDDILRNGRRFYRPSAAFIPVEFQTGTYRVGHSMVRPSYRANLAGDAGNLPFFAMIFDPAAEGMADPIDLRGGARAPRRFIGWQTFFDFGGAHTADVRPNKRIDTHISTPLFHLPVGAIPGPETEVLALPQRNLLRHITWSLPSGQAVARHLGVPVLAESDLAELSVFGLGLQAPRRSCTMC